MEKKKISRWNVGCIFRYNQEHNNDKFMYEIHIYSIIV